MQPPIEFSNDSTAKTETVLLIRASKADQFSNQIDKNPLRPPQKKWLLRWLEKYGLLLGSVFTLGGVLVALIATPVWPLAVLWTFVGATLVVLVVLVYKEPAKYTRLDRLVGPSSEANLGILGWLWVTGVVLTTSFWLHLITTMALWPAYILPYVLYISRKRQTEEFTWQVSRLIVLTTIILTIAGGLSAYRTFHTELSTGIQLRLLELVLSILAVVAWFGFGLVYIYYELRRTQLNQILAETMEQVFVELAHIEDPMAAAQTATELLYGRAKLGDRVFITQYHPLADELRVVAWAGEESQKAAGIPIPKGTSIARRALEEEHTIVVKDVTHSNEFYSGGLPEEGSEIVAPIIAREGSTIYKLGTIHVQSKEVNAFRDADDDLVKVTIETLANLLAAFWKRYTGHFEARLNEALQDFYGSRDPTIMPGQVVDAACQLFGQPKICYYRLGAGNGVPLQPPFTGGEFFDRSFFESGTLLDADSDLIRWICSWDFKFIPDVAFDQELQSGRQGFGKDFQEREGIRAICFLPIGTKNVRVGALLMFFKKEKIFSRSEWLNLITFAREISPYMAQAEYAAALYHGFARPQLHFHSTMAEAGLGKGALETAFDRIMAMPSISTNGLIDDVLRLRKGLSVFLDRVRAMEATAVARFGRRQSSDSISLKDELRDVIRSLKDKFSDVRLLPHIQPEIEEENTDMKLIIYVFVTEIMRNSVIHGKTARTASVNIYRRERNITIEAWDDGCGFNPYEIEAKLDSAREHGIRREDLYRIFDPDAPKPGADGIFELERLAEKFLDAPRIDWRDTAPGRGTRLTLTLPALPLLERRGKEYGNEQ
jgi:putative methionine-R-sulfoxide reductase with GAF domain